ncbi:hypothetical protein JCGZ_12652 [Jatropha curcas]|uniref:Uncharacterized protein n=1 Tax=Jatropha curcas TaxID=180498 RepID=A0A067KR66_JATCU|nr:hypothetical protein JCGZ_12652 [Jatropha curcas]
MRDSELSGTRRERVLESRECEKCDEGRERLQAKSQVRELALHSREREMCQMRVRGFASTSREHILESHEREMC